MAYGIQKLKHIPEKCFNWPENQQSAADIKLFNDVVKGLETRDRAIQLKSKRAKAAV